MKKIVFETEFSEEQLNIIRGLASECNLCADTVKILYGRGYRDKQSIIDFIHPSKNHFISPFKMSGMKEAVELITRARNEDWAVVVYGDYDADGICASTILGNALKDFGIQPYVIVPERRDGYGLSAWLIDSIFDEIFPQLFITVDCGISCAEEVEYIKEMGAEVIVTDHHELPETIPDCICINPKFEDDYIYDNLCGAGVAFKLGCALNGESAYKYLDFAAIATVADSVPLTGENRDIVAEGLKLINKKPAKGYAQFLGKTETAATSHTLAFSIAPKINAAGRMGDAKAALTLFSETDENKIFDLAAKLAEYNIERQKCCDELYLSAKEMLKTRGEIGNVIMLCNENWNSGFVGIVAARLADEYSRPAILFVKNGDMLKGSARSVESVNIFEALRASNQYIAEFGGHSQAAGVNVTVENFGKLFHAVDEYIGANYSKEDFEPSVMINGVLDKEYSLRFARELELLEPYGVGNRRPLFEIDVTASPVRAVKAGSTHISVKNDKIELMFIGGSKFAPVLESSAPKKIIFEYNISYFRGREYVKGFIRDVIYGGDIGRFVESDIAFGGLDMLDRPVVDCSKNTVSDDYIDKTMAECGSFGTVFICQQYSTLKKYRNSAKVNAELFVLTAKNGASCILIAPRADVDLSGYKKIIILDNKYIRLPTLGGRTVEVSETAGIPDYIKNISCRREDLLKVFAAVSANEENIEGTTAQEVAKKCKLGFSEVQIYFALKVFGQLSLIDFSDGRLKVIRGVKSDLKNSELYNTILKIQTEQANGRS